MADHLCDYQYKISPSKQLKQLIKDNLKDIDDDTITFKTVKKLHSILQQSNSEISFHKLIKGCDIILPKPPVIVRSKELEARIQKLKEDFEQKQYTEMTKGVDVVYRSKNVLEFRSDVKIMQSHMAAGINLLITVGACFLFGYKFMDFVLPTAPHMASKVLSGLLFGGIGALADLYFLIKHIDS